MENEFQPLVIYKNKQQITNTQQLPISHGNRICTDLFCTVFSAIFAVTMLIIALINFDLNKLSRTTYPTDIDGRLCTLDNNGYNYLYFTSPSDTTKRLCVSKCPKGNETSLLCLPSDNLSCKANNNSKFEVLIYPTEQTDTSLGLFCMPKDQKLKQTILKNSKLKEKYLFVSAYRSLWYSAACSIGLGILFLILTSLFSGAMVYVSIVMGGIGCIGIGILLLIVNSELLHGYNTLKIIFCIFIIIIGIMSLLSLYTHANDLKLCVSYLRYAGKLFSKSIFLVILSFLFLLFVVGHVALMIFQILSYWSHGQLQFLSDDVYQNLGDTFSIILVVICAVEFFWGLAFLKQSFNFLISAVTTYFYYNNKHSIPFALGNLFKFHWGSVVAGSFILDFFYIFDIFYDFIKPRNEQTLSVFATVCCCCDRVLGMSRSDTFSLINIIGQPYCNSARYCEQIDQRSVFFDGSQSVFRFFRIGSHVMLASISTLLNYIFMLHSQNQVSVLSLIFSFIVNMFVVTFFVSLMAEMAEAIFVCTLVESYIKNQNQAPIKYGKNKFSVAPSKFTKNQQNSMHHGAQGGYTVHYTQP